MLLSLLPMTEYLSDKAGRMADPVPAVSGIANYLEPACTPPSQRLPEQVYEATFVLP